MTPSKLREAVARAIYLSDPEMPQNVADDAADAALRVVREASLNWVNLNGANLTGANLDGAILRPGITATGAPARRATRADGYEFFLWPTSAGWRVMVGCRFFSMDEAWRHWETTRDGWLRPDVVRMKLRRSLDT